MTSIPPSSIPSFDCSAHLPLCFLGGLFICLGGGFVCVCNGVFLEQMGGSGLTLPTTRIQPHCLEPLTHTGI